MANHINEFRDVCETMGSIHDLLRGWPGKPVDPGLKAGLSYLEKRALSLMPHCHKGSLNTCVAVVRTRSSAIIQSLPKSRVTTNLAEADTEIALSWMTPDDFRRLIATGIGPTESFSSVLAHQPGDLEWTQVAIELLSLNLAWTRLIDLDIADVPDLDRFAKFLRSLVEHRPDKTPDLVKLSFATRPKNWRLAAALVLAGASHGLPAASRVRDPHFREILESTRSNHAALNFRHKHGDLELFLQTWKQSRTDEKAAQLRKRR